MTSRSLARQLGALYSCGSAAGLSDRHLLERFVAGRDATGEAAFAALVARHGPMVLGICQQLLGDRQHAEDAFQAVFLVLARKARSLREPELLGNWLYGVALRTARKARGRLARCRRTESEASARNSAMPPTAPVDRTILDRERAEIIHGEIDRLPRDFRLPVVLCYFEGLSLDEAAHRLKWPVGTLRSRLARAREKLRLKLTSRGVAMPAVALGTALAARSARASVSSLLCDSTTRAAIAFAARHAAAGGALAAPASALAQEVLKSMLWHKLKSAALSLSLLATLAAGAGYLSRSPATARDEPRPAPAAQSSTVTAKPNYPRPSSGRMVVVGRVLKPDGSPAAGVPVDILGASRTSFADTDIDRAGLILLGQGSTDGAGQFRVEAARASSTGFFYIYAVAGPAGPGTAFGCVRIPADSEEHGTLVHLLPEQVIQGKLVDVSGQPAAGVEVQLNHVYRETLQPVDGKRFDDLNPVTVFDRPFVPAGVRAWPRAVTTDAKGRFTFTGIGRGLHVSLSVRDPRFARELLTLRTDDRDGPLEVAMAIRPSLVIAGRALAADTGQPLADAVVSVRPIDPEVIGQRTMTRTDAQGRFQLNPYAGDKYVVQLIPALGQPYLPRETVFPWPRGAVRKELEIKLDRGVVIRGKVLEEGTGRPVPGASVRRFPGTHRRDEIDGLALELATGEGGSFQLTVPPGKGYVTGLPPTLDHVPREFGSGQLFGGGRPGGRRIHVHDAMAYDVKAGEGPHELNATLKPGKTLRGRLVGPAGETPGDTVILSPQQINPTMLEWQEYHFIHAHDGRFELAGFNPDESTPVYFLDTDHAWGARVELSGKQAGEDLTIRLEPCGQAKVRFVGPDGKPVAKLKPLYIYFQILMRPGPSRLARKMDRGKALAADGAYIPNVDPRHHPNDLTTDADGRVTLPALIPGAPYRIGDWSTVNVQDKGYQVRKDFTVKPGETLDLGDILVEKPQSQ